MAQRQREIYMYTKLAGLQHYTSYLSYLSRFSLEKMYLVE